jgi:hypothetical protein
MSQELQPNTNHAQEFLTEQKNVITRIGERALHHIKSTRNFITEFSQAMGIDSVDGVYPKTSKDK